jgi:hypothetical protein
MYVRVHLRVFAALLQSTIVKMVQVLIRVLSAQALAMMPKQRATVKETKTSTLFTIYKRHNIQMIIILKQSP